MWFARVISFLANPIFILISLPYFLVLKSSRDPQAALYWTRYTWAFLFVFVVFVLAGVRKKFFSDIDISNRKQRPILYLVGVMLSLFYLFGLFILHGPAILFITIIGIMLGIFFGSLINMKVKASVHVAAISALVTALILVYKGYFVLLLLFIPLVCWARIKMKRHTLTDVIVGGIFGSLLSWIMYAASRSIINL